MLRLSRRNGHFVRYSQVETGACEVSIAGDAADALQRIREEQPDAVLMDVVMPGVNGFQATRTLSRDPATAQIPVIVVSAKNQETDRVWALRQGAKAYLVKPFKDADLVKMIEQVLGER